MSYILDALKKADADREREAAAVPDLYAQADALRGARAAARAPAWMLPAGAAGAVALGALGWWWLHSAPDVNATAPTVAQTPAAVPPLPPLAPPPRDTASPMPATTAPLNAPTAAPTPAPPPPLPPPAPAPAFAVPPAPRPATAKPPEAAGTPGVTERAPTPAPNAPPALAAATPAAPSRPASGAELRLPTLAELPADLRSQLPPMSVGGSMYSPNAASRMVIVNGQVLREGDKPLDGLTVEQIRLKSTVMVFRGVRFELRH